MDRGRDSSHMGANLPSIDLGDFAEVVTISAGKLMTCAVLTTGGVKCWGAGNYGQLGYGDITRRGNAPGQMGDNLPEIDLGNPYTAIDVSVGTGFACAALTGMMCDARNPYCSEHWDSDRQHEDTK